MKIQGFILLGILLLLSTPSLSQDSLYARQSIGALTSDAFKGRGYAFKGDSIAAAYIANEFANLKLKNWGKDYFQDYTVAMNVFEGKVKIDFGKKYPAVTFSDILHIAAFSPAVKGRFKIIPATDDMLENRNTSKTRDNFICVDMTQYGGNEEKKKQWRQCMFDNSMQSKGYIVLNEKLSPYSPFSGRVKLSHTVVDLVKDSVSGLLKKVSIDLDARFIDSYQTRNVCGYIEGKQYPDTFFVIGAHYDHIGQMGNDYIFHGANDNAAGVAMLLDLARYFNLAENQPDYSIAFVTFSGEEIGLLGSSYFVENAPMPLPTIKMMLNLDLVGTGEEGITLVCGAVFTDEFAKFVSLNDTHHYVPQLLAREAAPNSDHYPFYKKGCKALFMYGMGKSGGYHQPSDTLENLSLGGYKNLFRIIRDYIQLYNLQ
jgi:hypothetical protein